MILYHKSNLVYIIIFPQFLIFQQNNSAQTSVLIFFTSRHYYFFEKLKIVEKQLCKLNCSYGKVLHTIKNVELLRQNNSAQTSVLIFFTSRHYYFFEKLKIVEKQLCKLNCSYGKVLHTIKIVELLRQNNSAQTSVLIFFTSRHYYFFEKLKIVEK